MHQPQNEEQILIDAEEFNHNGSRKWPDLKVTRRNHISQPHAWDVWEYFEETWLHYNHSWLL